MGKFISEEKGSKIADIMFRDFADTPQEQFLRREFERYVPEFSNLPDEAVREFIAYQRRVWLEETVPILGRPIASLNPTFTDSAESIVTEKDGVDIYTRVAVKENGYRLQLHVGPQEKFIVGQEPDADNLASVTGYIGHRLRVPTPGASAFTRQFTRYDLRMFPELEHLFDELPVMIGDAEIVNAAHENFAGFNRIKQRIPQSMWPKRGYIGVDDGLLAAYLADPRFFRRGSVLQDQKVTLAFHGLFAIADPKTWGKSREEQFDALESLCTIPMDYRLVDRRLDELGEFMSKNRLNAHVVDRWSVSSPGLVAELYSASARQNLEGIVVVQTGQDAQGDLLPEFGKSFKIKKYENIDTVLLGVNLKSPEAGVRPDNLASAVLGLYDETFGCYLPVARVNLDPDGVQLKTVGQKKRTVALNEELCAALEGKSQGERVLTLYDVYLMEAGEKLKAYIPSVDPDRITSALESIPRGQTFQSLFEEYAEKKDEYLSAKRQTTKKGEWIVENASLMDEIRALEETAAPAHADVVNYLSMAADIRAMSRKLDQPDVVISTNDPVIVEARIFDIKWAKNPYPAGFHSWYGNSFHFTNCFAEQLRPDKNTTTDYQTIFALARRNMGRKKK